MFTICTQILSYYYILLRYCIKNKLLFSPLSIIFFKQIKNYRIKCKKNKNYIICEIEIKSNFFFPFYCHVYKIEI